MAARDTGGRAEDVATVYERFSEALRALGNGQVADGAVMPTSPAQARAAEWPEDLIARASARALDVPYAESLAHRPVSHQFLQSVPIGFARRHGVVGLADGAAETGDTGCLTLALADLATLWMAVVADMGASLIVIANGLRLLGPWRRDGRRAHHGLGA